MKKLAAMTLLAAVMLSGCGGGDDEAPPPATSQVPASASASIGGFIAYLQTLVVSMADTLEPVDVGAVTPPTDETSEPQVVD
jgi:hypothetical protein